MQSKTPQTPPTQTKMAKQSTLIPMTAQQREVASAQKLRLILARAEVKVAQGLPLSVQEEDLVARLDAMRYEKRRESISVDASGTVHVKTSIDAEPVMEAIKAYGDFIDRTSRSKTGHAMVGAIDPVTAANWMRETGLKIGTREFAQFAIKRIKHDSEYRKFRVGH